MPERPENSHKGTFGKVLNVSGSDYMPGAAVLSSLAALKIGCGYVFLASSERVIDAAAAQTQNIVFVQLKDIQKHLADSNVLLIGCGLSTSESAVEIFKNTISSAGNIRCVIDADGLNILSGFDDFKIPENSVLTPHPKEAARLLGVETDMILSDIEYYAKEISKKYNSVTVLKTHNTVVCSKNLEIYVNNTGNSAMAKAGSGDVLAGMVAGLLAQRCEPFYAAKLGVYLHGLAGDLAKNDLTSYGVMASDLVRYISYAVKTLL